MNMYIKNDVIKMMKTRGRGAGSAHVIMNTYMIPPPHTHTPAPVQFAE